MSLPFESAWLRREGVDHVPPADSCFAPIREIWLNAMNSGAMERDLGLVVDLVAEDGIPGVRSRTRLM